MTRAKSGALLAGVLLLAACRTGDNYVGSDAPRHAGVAAHAVDPGPADTLRVVTFNIAFAREIDAAIELLSSHPDLRDADVLLLQEMDAPATERIAQALGMRWVYYPAIRSRRTDRDFGNAVLSSWPIVADARLVLPHRAGMSGTQRIATGVSIAFGRDTVRVYSTHLGAAFEIGDAARRDQMAAILHDAARYERVVIGGDLNDEDAGRVALERGYDWPTREGPRTTAVARWDHVLTRGFAPPPSTATGTVVEADGISDHRPVWVRLVPAAIADLTTPE